MAAISGRPDGHLSKFIYADGAGGVCRDMRYSANGVDLVDFYEADLRVKNGEYRGFEKLRFTRVAPTGTFPWSTIQMNLGVVSGTARVGWGANSNVLPIVGDTVFIGTKSYKVVSIELGTQLVVDRVPDLTGYTLVGNEGGWDMYTGQNVVLQSNTNTSIGGSFLQTDVIGDPAKILQMDSLKNGWEGSWIPKIPNSTSYNWELTRKKVVSGGITRIVWNGSSWATYTTNIDEIQNQTSPLGFPVTETVILQYQAFAKQTEVTSNTEIYSGVSGVGGAYSNARFSTSKGALLGESLIDKICISDNQSSIQSRTLALSSFSIWENGLLSQDNFESAEHSVLNMGSPTNSSPAFKALNYNTVINQQANINYATTELKWDGTDWGDDSKITIVNGESTKTDLNGNTVKVVTHKLKEPIGWCKLKL